MGVGGLGYRLSDGPQGQGAYKQEAVEEDEL